MHWFHRFWVNLVLNILALVVVDQLLAQVVIAGGWLGYAVVGVIFGLVNVILKPILKLVTLPLMFLTAGLFIFVLNAALLFAVQIAIPLLEVPGVALQIEGGWLTYFWASILLGAINTVEHWIVHVKR